MIGNAYPPNVSLWADPSNSTYRWNYVINLKKCKDKCYLLLILLRKVLNEISIKSVRSSIEFEFISFINKFIRFSIYSNINISNVAQGLSAQINIWIATLIVQIDLLVMTAFIKLTLQCVSCMSSA